MHRTISLKDLPRLKAGQGSIRTREWEWVPVVFILHLGSSIASSNQLAYSLSNRSWYSLSPGAKMYAAPELTTELSLSSPSTPVAALSSSIAPSTTERPEAVIEAPNRSPLPVLEALR